jgi:Leucine-rich repeat (LRR) protein
VWHATSYHVQHVLSCIPRFDSPQDLDVSRNALTALPPQLGACTGLVLLNAMANALEAVPPELGGLRSLYRLGLKSNR